MPSNEERREVASRIREAATDIDIDGYISIAIAIVDKGEGSTWEEFALRLADLIDPEPERTCAMEYCDEWSGDELYPTEAYTCSICGYIELDGKTNYCSNCGAKVIEE